MRRQTCRPCERAHQRQYYASKRAYYRRKNQEFRRRRPTYHAQRVMEIRLWVDEYKNRPCADCGVTYPPPVMELDHVRGDKLKTVAQMAHGGYGRETIMAELAKCEVRCANCHRIRHYQPTEES